MLYFLQQVLNGLHSGALYALLAFGYALTNGVLKQTNLAYGALFAFGGQMTILVAVFGWYVLVLTLPATLLLGIVAALAYAALVSAVLSRHVFGPLSRRSPRAIVVVTLGVAIALMELVRIGADTRDFWLPPLLASPVVFAGDGRFPVTLTVIQLVDCAVAALLIAAAALLLQRSRYGRLWRAVCDDSLAAELCGVDVDRVFRGAVLGGSMAAASAGILAALYYGNVSFGTGMVFGLKILFITAIGGYRSPLPAAAGAMAFAMAEALWSGYFPIEWRDASIFAFLAAMLVLRPGPRDDAQQA